MMNDVIAYKEGALVIDTQTAVASSKTYEDKILFDNRLSH
jgi:threonyl-tRNA synthetase